MTRQVKTRKVMAGRVMMLGMTVVLTAGLSACSDFRRAIGEANQHQMSFKLWCARLCLFHPVLVIAPKIL